MSESRCIVESLINIFFSVFSFIESSAFSFSSNKVFSVWGEFEFGNKTIGRIDWNFNKSSISFLFLSLFDIDAPSSSIDLLNFAFNLSLSTSDNEDFIIFSNGKGLNTMFFSEFLGKVRTHEFVFEV